MAKFFIKPAKLIPPKAILKYWTTLSEVYPFLEYRFCNLKNPTIEDAMGHTYQNPFSVFFVMRNISMGAQDQALIAEYTIETFQTFFPKPATALMHFSFNPFYKKDLLEVAEYAHKTIFSSTLRSLVGLTPVTNKPAQIMLKRLGYKRLTVLPGAAYHHGEPVDGILSVRMKDE